MPAREPEAVVAPVTTPGGAAEVGEVPAETGDITLFDPPASRDGSAGLGWVLPRLRPQVGR